MMFRPAALPVALGLALVTSSTNLGTAGVESPAQASDKPLLALARAALGGEDRLGRVRGLEFEGDAQSITAGQVMSNDIVQFEFVPPDRYIRRSERSFPPTTERQGFEGERYVNEARSRDPGMTVGFRQPSPQFERSLVRWQREIATAYLVAVLLTERTALPVAYRSAGRATSPDGEADVLEAATADGYVVRVFLDDKSHRPLMAQYSEGIETKTHSAMTLYLADHRRVDGVWFPHEWRIAQNGQPRWAFKVRKVRLSDR